MTKLTQSQGTRGALRSLALLIPSLALVVPSLAALGSTAARGHAYSEGESTFTFAADGAVAIEVRLHDVDMPELCDAELGMSDPTPERAKLAPCFSRGVPIWIRLRVDDAPCVPSYSSFRAQGRALIIAATASCAPVRRDVVVEWGMFSGTPLDHQNRATFVLPEGEPVRRVFSKRSPRARIGTAPSSAVAGFVVACVAVVAALTLWGVARWRRPRRV